MPGSPIEDSIRVTLQQTPPFDLLSGEVLDATLSDTSVQQFEAGEVIIQQGDRSRRGLYVVGSGLVRVMEADQRRLIDLCGEGDYFGAFGLIQGGAHIYQASAVEPSVCVLVDRDRFLTLYNDHPAFAAYFDDDLKMYVRRMGTQQDVTGARRLFNQRLGHFTYDEPLTCDPETTVEEAARLMTRRQARAVLVTGPRKIRGLITDRSLRSRVLARGRALDTPVKSAMETSFHTVDADVSVFDAMMGLLETGARWLVVMRTDDHHEPVAVLTDRDLAHLRGQDPLATMRRIDAATDVSQLLESRSAIHDLLLRLYRQGTPPEALGRIIAVLTDRLMSRVIQLVEADLRRAHTDERVDLPWVWMRLGSGGRREAALSSHQHNALVYADPSSEEEAERAAAWFNRLAEAVNGALERCGYQPSEVVAREPRWRGPLRTWRRTYREWILASDDADLVPTPLFFDLRPLYGEASLVEALRETIEDALNVQAMDEERRLLPMLARQAVAERPPLSIFRRFLLERSGENKYRFDIRRRGVLPIVDAARLLALETRYLASTNTFDRLRHAAEAIPELGPTLLEAREAYQYILDFRLERQLHDVELGEPPANHIDPGELTRLQQNVLRNAFTAITALQQALVRRYELRQGLPGTLRNLTR